VSKEGREKKKISRGGNGVCDNTTKGIVGRKGVKEESGTHPMIKGAGVLWRGHT